MARRRRNVRKDERPIPGASATGSNAGPARVGVFDDEDFDVLEGTTSGSRVRGKPARGSRDEIRY